MTRLALSVGLAFVASCASQAVGVSPDGTGDSGVDASPTTVRDGALPDVANRPRERCNGVDDDGDGRVDEGCPIRITRNPQHDAFPSVSGRTVAWVRFDAQYTGDVGDAYVRTLPDGQERRVATGVRYPRIAGHRVAYLRDSAPAVLDLDTMREQRFDAPDASYVQAPVLTERYIAWSQNMAGAEEDYEVIVVDLRVDPLWNGGRVMALDLASGRTITVSDRRSNHPSVDGAAGRVVFESTGATDYEWDIWEWTLRDGVARAITGREGDEHEPESSGDRLVFTRGTGVSPLFNRDIVVRDLRDGTDRVLSTGLEGFQTEPAIDGDRVVWRQQIGSSAPSRVGILWLFDLATGMRRRIDEGGVAYDPRISGEIVCWSTLSGEPGGLTVLDLATGRARVLSREGHHCDVEGRRVVWLEGSSAVDVFWRDLLPGEP